jgi:hypothetical protein
MDSAEDRLALIERLGSDGRATQAEGVWRWPLRIGRALDNDIVLDDPHVAPHHALLGPDEGGQVQLTLLPSTNGVLLDGQRHAAPGRWPLTGAGAVLQLGGTRLRVRLRGEVLAAERPLASAAARGAVLPKAQGAALLLLALAETGVALDPGADATAWLPVLVGLPALLGAWCGLWALLSKLFQHRFDFTGHLRVALPWMVGIQLTDLLLPQAAAALAWPWLWYLSSVLLALQGAAMVHGHLRLLLPQHTRAVAATVIAATLAGSVVSLILTQRSSDSFSRAPYMSTLPLPALHVARPVPAAELVQGMAPLAERLERRVKKAQQEEREHGDADDTFDD